MMFRLIFIFIAFSAVLRAAESVSANSPKTNYFYTPWYTGPHLSPSAVTIPKGVIDVQPYLYVIQTYGLYGQNWRYESLQNSNLTINPIAFVQYGVNTWMDLSAIFQTLTSYQQEMNSTNYGDTFFRVGFQIMRDKKGTATPDIKAGVGMSFPTGKYQNLSPDNYFNQNVGEGCYQIVPFIGIQKFFPDFQLFSQSHNPYRLRLTAQYWVPMLTTVSNFNSYGGGFGTYGTVNP